MKKSLLIAAILVGVSVDANIISANASAGGIEYFGTHTIEGHTIPSGQLEHIISGKGLHVKWDGANFVVAGNICDSSIRFTYGNGTSNIDGNVHRGCSAVGQWKYAINSNKPRGRACAELWSENWTRFVAKQCHYIHN